MTNNIWELVLPFQNLLLDVIGFTIQVNLDGSVALLKDKLTSKDYSQICGIDYLETLLLLPNDFCSTLHLLLVQIIGFVSVACKGCFSPWRIGGRSFLRDLLLKGRQKWYIS